MLNKDQELVALICPAPREQQCVWGRFYVVLFLMFVSLWATKSKGKKVCVCVYVFVGFAV